MECITSQPVRPAMPAASEETLLQLPQHGALPFQRPRSAQPTQRQCFLPEPCVAHRSSALIPLWGVLKHLLQNPTDGSNLGQTSAATGTFRLTSFQQRACHSRQQFWSNRQRLPISAQNMAIIALCTSVTYAAIESDALQPLL